MQVKPIATAVITASILFGVGECMQIKDAFADYSPTTQRLDISDNPLLFAQTTANFSRGNYEIIEVAPWLKPENQKLTLSDEEVIAILKQAGFSGYGLKMAWAVAVKESTLRPYALNKSSNCYGLFQINMSGAMGTDRRSKYELSRTEDLYNPLINATIAFDMSNGGLSWNAWEAYGAAKDIISQFPG